ncbi:hypothetical protein [Streptacidiphilus sp. EB129]|uniref:hypothetical protein n=1 Tax=Streptacidiphilus sp. EB129 TaxID=3156262 RepID=UPI00351362BB
MSKKDDVPAYQPDEPDPTEPTRNDILTHYGLGSEETEDEREMREWEEEQARKLAAQEAARRAPAGSAAAVVPAQQQGDGAALQTSVRLPVMPEFTLADSEASRVEQLQHYARTVIASERAAQNAVELIEQHRILATGGGCERIREEELWRERGYDSFDACCLDLFGFTGDYANKTIRVLPVVRALGSLASTVQLKERQLRALVSVVRDHGDQGAQEVWQEAARLGRTSGAGLEEAAKALGYGPAVEISGTVVGTRRSPAAEFDYRAEAVRLLNFDGFRRIAEKHHAEAHNVLSEMRRMLDEAEKELAARQSADA